MYSVSVGKLPYWNRYDTQCRVCVWSTVLELLSHTVMCYRYAKEALVILRIALQFITSSLEDQKYTRPD
jgi:hypothetical protein